MQLYIDNRSLTPLEREDIGAVLDEVGLPVGRQQICLPSGAEIFARKSGNGC